MANVFSRDVSSRTSSIVTTLSLLFFLPFLLYGVYEVINLISRATEAPAVIVVNTKSILEPISTDYYHAFAQGGEEQSDMIAPVADLVSPLRPKYIRIDHLYDSYNVVKNDGGNLSYDFSRLDNVVNTITSLGAKPVLALSYMPAAIARDGVIINPPTDWGLWSSVVQRTIEHYSGKGEKNLTSVYYEVWNEPDLAQFGGWKLYGDKNYLDLYRNAAAGASRAQNVNRFYIGGPATTGLYQNWITAVARSGARVDFFSWHSYLPDPLRFSKNQDSIIAWLTRINPELILKPRLITEFGFTGDKSKGYGTMYAAAHTAAVITRTAATGITSLFTFQLKDGPGQEAGNGWGLLTHETNGKRAKPRYYIYSFIDVIAGNRLQTSGGNSFVSSLATTKAGIIRVLLVNFDYSGSHSEVSTVTFSGLNPGTYKYRQHFLLGQDVTLKETVEEDTLTKQIVMPAQSIVMLELSRLP